MLLGFKQRFAGFVEEGSKTHTIRARRKVRPRVGEVCHCYYALRTKVCRLLGRWTCVKVQEIIIRKTCGDHPPEYLDEIEVLIDGVALDRGERNQLAWVDGFRGNGIHGAFAEMVQYWTSPGGRTTDPPELPFLGDVIHWAYKAGTNVR